METLYSSTSVLYEEPLLPIAEKGQPADGWLLLEPTELLSITNGNATVRYVQGRDFYFEGRRLVLTPESSIPFLPQDALYPPANAPMAKGTHRHSDGWLLWDEGLYLISRQLRISYTHAGWDLPASHHAGSLPRTSAMLAAGQDLKLAFWGDSITAGGNASAYVGSSPWLPAFPERVCLMLDRNYGISCTLYNEAVPGMVSSWGVDNAGLVGRIHPNLCVIAFGMNDGFHRVSPADYANNVHQQMQSIRSLAPACEFVLVATMWGNPDRVESSIDLYDDYRDALASLCGVGCALADLTTPWEGFLQRKRPISLYASGINHPTDFGHAFYAQTIFEAIAHNTTS